jgi:large subunit ribosomal protein L35
MSHKMKTHKGTKKRFRITATGKIKHRASGKSHRNVRMSAKRTRNLRGGTMLDDCMVKSVTSVLGKYSY